MPQIILPTRREFIRRSALVVPVLVSASRLRAAASHRMTIGLSQYSLKPLFASKQLDPLDYPAFARKEFGLTALDVWEGALPKERLDDHAYLRELRQRADAAGTHFFLLMTGVLDATAPIDSTREAKAAEHFPAVERAVSLGCRYLRIFLKAPVGERTAAVVASADSLRPLCDRAKARGITIIIEPGASKFSTDGAFLAEVMGRLAHAHCRLMPDFGKLTGDIYEGTRAMMPYASVISAKTHEFDAAGNQVEFDYFRLMKIVADAGFEGVVAIEWEGKRLEPVAGVHASKKLIERALAAL